MPYMIAVSLEMSDEPYKDSKKNFSSNLFYFSDTP